MGLMRLVRQILDAVLQRAESAPLGRRLHPVFEALDEACFGTGKTTQGAPHIADAMDIKRYMGLVILALAPAVLAGVYFYGLKVLAMIAVSYVCGGTTEVLFATVRRKSIHEGFLVTGLIFPLILPPGTPLWMVGVGIAFGVFFGKEVFGGTGRNIFNPALVGRVFLSLAFPEHFATMWRQPLLGGAGGFLCYTGGADAVTSATPLIGFKTSQALTDWGGLLFGAAPGSVGETFRIGLIAGGLLLILTKVSDWRIPLSYILSVVAVSLLGNSLSPKFAPALFQLLSGGLVIGAFFMATDPVTSPLTTAGKWVFGVLLGVLTVLIRALSTFPEGVMFSILLMNALSPLIDTIVVGIKFRRNRTGASSAGAVPERNVS